MMPEILIKDNFWGREGFILIKDYFECTSALYKNLFIQDYT